MIYAILWISHVGFGLFLVAAATAVSSRCKRLLWRRCWPIFSSIFVFILFIPLILAGYHVMTDNFQPKWLFWYGLSEMIVSIIGLIIILFRGLKGSSTQDQVCLLYTSDAADE